MLLGSQVADLSRILKIVALKHFMYFHMIFFHREFAGYGLFSTRLFLAQDFLSKRSWVLLPEYCVDTASARLTSVVCTCLCAVSWLQTIETEFRLLHDFYSILNSLNSLYFSKEWLHGHTRHAEEALTIWATARSGWRIGGFIRCCRWLFVRILCGRWLFARISRGRWLFNWEAL